LELRTSYNASEILFGGLVPSFYGVLNLLIPNGEKSCQTHVFNLLKEMAQVSILKQSFAELLQYFHDQQPVKYAQTNFKQLLEMCEN